MSFAKILIVDDESNIRLMLRTLLESDGHTVSEAANGKEALSAVRREDFDLMILDLNMPVLDGMGVLGQLKESEAEHKPRVIAAAVKATRLGALDFMEKPATPDEIRQTIAAVLSEPEPARPDAEAGGYSAVLDRVRRALRLSDFATAETLLLKAADLALGDAAYYNLLGIIYEARHQLRLAKKLYGKAMKADRAYLPAQQNMRRIYELNTFGRTAAAVALGDETDGTWFSQLARGMK
jgi:DNA-binding response OmpR family regulator